jgi:hypothetical protein
MPINSTLPTVSRFSLLNTLELLSKRSHTSRGELAVTAPLSDKERKLAARPAFLPMAYSPLTGARVTERPDLPVSTDRMLASESRGGGSREESQLSSSIDKADWTAAQGVVKRGNPNIRDGIKSVMKKTDILVIGETHVDSNPVRMNSVEILRGAHQGGARTLFVELPEQKQIDRFVKSGNPSELPSPVPSQPAYVAMLNEAKRLGMKIIAVDPEAATAGTPQDNRDKVMHNIIKKTPRQQQKAVFWVGALHALPATLNNGKPQAAFQSAAQLLARSGLRVTTVVGVGGSQTVSGSPDDLLRSDKPVLVNPSKLPAAIRRLENRLNPSEISGYRLLSPMGGATFTLHN